MNANYPYIVLGSGPNAIRVRKDAVLAIVPQNTVIAGKPTATTLLYLSSGTLFVQESPEQVIDLLQYWISSQE